MDDTQLLLQLNKTRAAAVLSVSGRDGFEKMWYDNKQAKVRVISIQFFYLSSIFVELKPISEGTQVLFFRTAKR